MEERICMLYYIKSDEGYWNKEKGWVQDYGIRTLSPFDEICLTKLPKGTNVKWVLDDCQ